MLLSLTPSLLMTQRDHCSDYMVHSSDGTVMLDGHNEDGGGDAVNNTFVVHVILGNSSFMAYT
jgi:hypothetical protein